MWGRSAREMYDLMFRKCEKCDRKLLYLGEACDMHLLGFHAYEGVPKNKEKFFLNRIFF